MRMLVPGRPVKETPAAPPPVPVERPTYKEKFIPPELSMWDYFVAKVRSTGHQGSMLFMVLCHGIRSEFMLTSPLTLPPSLPQPFLPPSDSGALYDSDESGASDNDDDDDAFLSDTQMTEHSDPNSFRCGISGSFPVSHELQRGMIHTESLYCGVCVCFLSVLQLGSHPIGHGQTGPAQRQDLPSPHWAGLHR